MEGTLDIPLLKLGIVISYPAAADPEVKIQVIAFGNGDDPGPEPDGHESAQDTPSSQSLVGRR